MPDPGERKRHQPRVWHTSKQKHNSRRLEAGYNPVNFVLSANGTVRYRPSFWLPATRQPAPRARHIRDDRLYNCALKSPLPMAKNSEPTRSSPLSASVGWARCTRRGRHAWIATFHSGTGSRIGPSGVAQLRRRQESFGSICEGQVLKGPKLLPNTTLRRFVAGISGNNTLAKHSARRIQARCFASVSLQHPAGVL